MKFMTFASGSGGNCALVWNSDTRILIDAGISARRITAALASVGMTPRDVDAVLVTHGHSDHAAGLSVFLGKTAASVWASGGTASELAGRCPPERLEVFPSGAELRFGSMSAVSFSTPHDAAGSTGFVITGEDGARLAFVTDLGRVTQEVRRAVVGADAAILESNHDLTMLRTGPYPYPLKRRIEGGFGHLSNDDAGAFALELVQAGARYIVLAHLSETNNTPETAYRTVLAALGGTAAGVRLSVAPAACAGEVFDTEG